ncbi:MAG: threonine dehydratase [Gammaproteobacteria bacterium]|nr:threonine dehydratase [Gammaproteobacteria bacterium]
MKTPTPSLARLRTVTARVHVRMNPTPQIHWPGLSELSGASVWVKHENHTPTGAFKIRGGINYVHELKEREPAARSPTWGVVAASTGNHGQSVVYAARDASLNAVIVVPEGNNPDKNAAIRAMGGELIEHGEDFNAAFDHARRLAAKRGWHLFESFHPHLVEGVASYGLELLEAVTRLDAVYVPVGMGSGCCGVIAARDALGLDTEVIGVVATNAPAYLHSLEHGQPVSTNHCATFAEGLAVRIPHPDALAMLRAGVSRLVAVTEDDIADAVRQFFSCTHNIAEGAGAATLAALLQERRMMRGKRIAVVLSGGNIDAARYRLLLDGHTPTVVTA